MELLAIVAATWGVLAAWLAPGALLVTWLGLGRDRLERFVLAVALGRLLLAAVSVLAVSSVGAGAIHVWASAAALAWGAAWLRRRRSDPGTPEGGSGLALPLTLAVVSALLLVWAVVARGGLPDAAGNLVFHGRDNTNDPLVYAAMALQLHETGLPMTHPFVSGVASTSTYVPYGVLVGLHALGAPMLDLVLRVVPALEASALALTAVALVRMLGGNPAAAALGGILVVLGGDPAFWLQPLGTLFGFDVQALDTWTFFGPYLFAFNPGAPGLQLAFAAFLLAGRLRAGSRRAAGVAGLLVASVFETKLFLWAPLFAGLAGMALLRPPRLLAGPVRRMAGIAALASLPFLVEKLWWASTLRGRDETGFIACPGCLPRYLADAAMGSHELTYGVFERFTPALLASPGTLLSILASIALVVAVALGARAVALPALWRAIRTSESDAGESGRVLVQRWMALASAAALAAAMVFTTTPHYLNGAQFAWLATAGLWAFAAPTLGRWVVERRWLPLCVAAALTLPGTWHCLVRLGLAAPLAAAVPQAELSLLDELRARSAPEDVVLEPSMLANPDFPSPVAWHAGRSVHLSLLSTVQLLPKDELFLRHEHLVAVFAGADAPAARAAVAASGARWVYAPSAWPLRFDATSWLEPVVRRPAGILYRVREAPVQRGAR